MTEADLQALFESLAESSRARGMAVGAGLAQLQSSHAVALPSAHRHFMRIVGPGSWGSFLHFHAMEHMSTHEELLAPFMDEDLEQMLEPTADVLVFANSDNGDMCGWHLHDLVRMPPDDCPVIRIAPRSFDGAVIAASTAEFFRLLLVEGANLFGVGALPWVFQPRPLG